MEKRQAAASEAVKSYRAMRSGKDITFLARKSDGMIHMDAHHNAPQNVCSTLSHSELFNFIILTNV